MTGEGRLMTLELLKAQEKIPLLDRFIGSRFVNGQAINILEAGCGQRWLLKADKKRIFLTGVDIDKDALEIRKNVRKDLDEAIHGDLRTIEFEQQRFDVIYS